MALERNPHELLADFQQFYHLDLSWLILGTGGDACQIWRVATLLSQLPEGARLRVAENPDAAWDDQTHILRLIEYELRSWVVAHAKDAPEQEPIALPHEALRREELTKQAEQDMEEVARALGLIGGEEDAS